MSASSIFIPPTGRAVLGRFAVRPVCCALAYLVVANVSAGFGNPKPLESMWYY